MRTLGFGKIVSSALLLLLLTSCTDSGSSGSKDLLSELPDMEQPDTSDQIPPEIEFPSGSSNQAMSFTSTPMDPALFASNKTKGQIRLNYSAEEGSADFSSTSVSMKNNGNGNGNDHDDDHGDDDHGDDDHRGHGHRHEDPVVTSVLVTVTQVQVYHEIKGWLIVNSKVQKIDLMTLSTNAHQLMADTLLEPGTYKAIRIKMLRDSVVVADGKTIPLKIPSAYTSGLKLIGRFSVQKGFVTGIILKFDAKKSVFFKNRKVFALRPSIKILGVTEDLLAPTIAINLPLHGPTNVAEQLHEIEYFDEYIDLATLSIKVNGQELVSEFSKDEELATLTRTLADGVYKIEASVMDKARNVGVAAPITVTIDTVKPDVILGLENDIMTKEYQILLPVTVTDSSATYTEVRVNGAQVLTTGSKQFSIPITLTLEGDNLVEVTSTDVAGNISSVAKITIERDTTAPVLSDISPSEGDVVPLVTFTVSGKSNENLSSLEVNGTEFSLSADAKSFSDTYVSDVIGPVELEIVATDLVGNVTTKLINIEVTKPVIYSKLISIKPSIDNVHLIVKGAPGASRPGSRVSAYTGLFGFADDQNISNQDGSFTLKTNTAGLIKIKGVDLQTGETLTVDLLFDLSTSLAGVVFDSNAAPIPGVTVRIVGSNFQTTTDGAGSFEFLNVVSGDQTIEFDGTTALEPTDVIDRKFSVTRVKLSIGVAQRNTLLRPVYLASMPMDGSGTTLATNGSTTVTSEDAPGVQIEIPRDSAQLPQNVGVNEIFIRTLPAERSTVYPPLQAEPVNVYSLEPSGTTFTERADVIIPNENELPIGTELLIFSMNSETGQWELDGRAKVTDDGRSVRTNPNEGISHFSLIYAVPLKPLISEVGDPNVKGIDVGKGAFSTSVSLPSYKSIDKTVTPGLIYKSTWAKPTAFVSNRIDIPKMNSVMTFGQRNTKYETACPVAGICSIQEILIAIHNDTFVSDETMYIPDMIRSQAFIGSLRSNSVKFVDSTEVPTNRGDIISGPVFDESLNTDIVSMTGIPNKSVISYAVPLKDEVTGEYLKTGNYPYIARYEVRLKALTLRTITSTTSVFIDREKDEEHSGTVVAYDKFVSAIKNVLAEDVLGNVLVKNRVNSEFGQGWDLNLIQRIANPDSQRLIVEETDGSMSTYALKSSISTVMTGAADEDLSQAVSIQWPEVNYIKADSNGQPQVVSKLLDGNSTPNVLFKPSVINLTMANQNQTTCANIFGAELSCPYVPGLKDPSVPADSQRPDLNQTFYQAQRNLYGYYNSYAFPVTVNPTLSGFVTAQDGTIFYTNPKDHSLWRGTGTAFTRVGGTTMSVDEVYGGQGGAINIKFDGSNYAPIQEFCQRNFGADCAAGSQVARTNCSFTYEFVAGELAAYNSRQAGCGANNPGYESGGCTCDIFQPTHFFKGVSSTGQVGVPRYSGDDGSGSIGAGNVGFNNPGQLVAYTPGVYLVADTGNNRIRLINMNNNLVTTFAGDGSNFDSGDGVDAKLAKILHPIGLLVSSTGDVYISSERGYIRKVDSSGNLTIIGGAPVEAGGTQGEEGPIATFALHKPSHMALDETRNLLYISEPEKHRVVKFDLNTQRAVQVAGNGTCTANPTAAVQNALNHSLCFPGALAFDDNKNLIIVDVGHQQIKRINEFGAPNGLAVFEPSNRDLSVINKLADGFERVYRNGDKVKFDLSGKQIEQSDRVGRVTSFTYNPDSQLTKMRDHVGNELNLEYSGNLLDAMVDPANRRTSFSYSGGKLTAVNYPDGTSKKYEYDTNGLLTKEINQRNAATRYEYNEWNRLHKIINPLNEEVVLNDMVSGTMTNDYTDGNVGEFQQTGVGGNKSNDKIIDAKGTTTEVAKDNNGFVWKVKDADGNVTHFYRNEDGRTTKIVYADGSIIKMTYDPNTGDLLSRVDETSDVSESFTYNGFGQLISRKDGLGRTRSFQYNLQSGLLISELLPGGVTANYSYNGLGEKATKNISGINIENHEYDSKGNLIRSYTSDEKDTRLSYDLSGNVTHVIGKDRNGSDIITNYEFDLMNRITRVISGNGDSTQFKYLITGELSQIITPSSKTINYEYDLMGRLIKRGLLTGKSYIYAYDKSGNIEQEIDPNGNTILYKFDKMDRMEQVIFSDDSIEFSYNKVGRLISSENKLTKLIVNRDSRNRIDYAKLIGKDSMVDYPSIDLNFSYNKNDQLAVFQSPIYNANYNYDNANRLSSLTSSKGDSYSFGYDSANRLVQIIRPGSETNITYSPNQFVNSIIHSASGVTKSFWQYSYDARSLPISKLGKEGQTNFTYDNNSQLVGAVDAESGVESFTYDNHGNRILDAGRSYTYDSNLDLITEDSKFQYGYDNNGNLTSRLAKLNGESSYSLAYNSKNQLISIKVFQNLLSTPSREIFYTYDVAGRRIQKEVRDHSQTPTQIKVRRYVYSGNNIIGEYDGGNNLLTTYINSSLKDDDILGIHVTTAGVAEGFSSTAGSFFLLKDAMGTITDITNENGDVLQSYSYSSYGKIAKIKNEVGADTTLNPTIKFAFTFTGREYDQESGFYFYRARYYDPEVGRFLQRDPDEGNLRNPASVINKYTYVCNNPILFSDPSGEFLDIGLDIGNFLSGLDSWLEGNPVASALAVVMFGGNFSGTGLKATSGVMNWAGREGYAAERKYLADEPYNLIYNISDNEDYHNALNIYMNLQTITAEAGSIALSLYVAVAAPGVGTAIGGTYALSSVPKLETRVNNFTKNPRNDTWRDKTLLDHGATFIGARGSAKNLPK